MASIFPTGLTYSRNTKDPLQSKIVWDSLSAASIYVNNPDETAYVGMTLAVVNDSDAKNNGLWYVEAIGTKASPTAGVLKKVGSNEVLTAANYTEAVTLAQTAPIGTLIKVTASEGSVEEDNFHAAGFYIVSVTGANPSILMLSTTSGEDMDLDAVITALSDLQKTVATKADATDVYDKTTADATFVKDVQGQNVSIDRTTGIVTVDMSGKVDSTVYDKFVQDTNAALSAKLESSDLAEYAKTADVVSATTYATDKQATDSAIGALETKVGNKAEGETVASGLFKDIEDLRADITAIPKFDIEVVDELPTEGISESTVYLVKDKESDGDLYTEYIYVNGAWENLGKQTVDLSSYSTTSEMNTAISDAINALKIGDYYKKTEVDGLLANKADSSALNDYVLTADFNSELGKYVKSSELETYKGEVNTALESYVKNTVFEEYKESVTDSLAEKLDDGQVTTKINDALSNYVTSDTLNNTLSNYVQSSVLSDYVSKTELNTALNNKADKSELDAYIKTEKVTNSGSLQLYTAEDGSSSIEVNVITTDELNAVINGETSI